MTFKTLILLVCVALFADAACYAQKAGDKSSPQTFTVQIKDKPMTFCNPLTFTGAGRAGEPIMLIFNNDYYLFITGRKGYWFSPNMRDWTYVDSPTFPAGVPGVVTDGKILYACAMNSKDLYSCTDPKKGVWTKVATMDSDRYGDADIFIDDDGRVFMYFGWSQLLPIQVVELDPKNGFKEKGKPVVCFFADPENHGFERRRPEDVIWPIMDYRPYYPEEIPWTEGPWMVKHNGKYYLQYASIGLEFLSYSHGVYVSDNPLGPFKYSEHNPLTFKTTGFAVGGGHGCTFHDKNGKLWTICMIPSSFGSGRGSSELAMFPTEVDAQGVMHSKTEFGDYPQYYPGIKENTIKDNFTGWMLLSNKKYVETSSTLKGFEAKNAVDENFRTFWSAETGNPGEYMTVDLGKECKVYAVQINLDQKDAKIPPRTRGFAAPANDGKPRQRYTLQVSCDNKNWKTLVDKSNNIEEIHHDYAELVEPMNVRYVKLTNVFTPDSGKFAVKDLRVFGNPEVTKFTKVTDVKVVRNPNDRRDATLLWEPVKGADGYIVRYGIEPNKLYNSYMVYDDNMVSIHSLNKNPDYYFEVEAFDNGTDYYREKTHQVYGVGAEIELSKDGGAQMTTLWGGAVLDRKMVKEGVSEYVFDNLVPGDYVLKHTFGPVLWRGKLTNAELIGTGDKPTITETVGKLGVGTTVTGQIEMKIIPGKESGKLVVIFNYNK
ncbi:MAG TPA: family 43 glycosylhydrolase [Bacteroidales bacterium]|nr:family 43 glycosylhydrolase [Bacteroidales bacterium]